MRWRERTGKPRLKIGSVEALPGEIVTGWFEGIELPTGGSDQFPVIAAQGRDPDGPVLWITTGIHGTEHTGIIAIHHLITRELVKSMRGTLIAVPGLSPAALRTKQRLAYYQQTDPNRLFPGPGARGREEQGAIQSGVEEAYERLFKAVIASRAGCLIDLHNAWIGSIPFAFRDPIFFVRGRRQMRGLQRADAATLSRTTDEVLNAFGFTTVNEFAAEDYVRKNLHRSVSGSILNAGGIPAFTVELGSWMHVDAQIVEACLAGCRNVMRWLGMLAGDYEPVTGIPIIQPGFAVRRHMAPVMPRAGIAEHLARPGTMIEVGTPLARVTDIFGAPLGRDDGILFSEFEGFVLGWQHGVIHNQGDAIMALAVHDNSERVVPFPD